VKLLKVFLASTLVVGCGGIKAPDARWGLVNPAGKEVVSYNLKNDYAYSEDGMKLKAKAKAVYLPVESLWDMEGWVCMPPQDFARARATVEKLISRHQEGCK